MTLGIQRLNIPVLPGIELSKVQVIHAQDCPAGHAIEGHIYERSWAKTTDGKPIFVWKGKDERRCICG